MRLSSTAAMVALGVIACTGASAQDTETPYNARHDFTYPAATDNAPAPMQAPPADAIGGALESGNSDFSPPVEHTVRVQNGISYITGGVGDEELAVIKAHASEFNLKVLTTAPNGEFIGTYTLTVTDAHGAQAFTAPSEGPLFYLKLPAGRYTIQETDQTGQTQQQKIAVSGGQRQIRFQWSAQE